MELEERLLEAWLDISTAINNDRLVKDLTYGEALVCHFIYLHGSKETLSSLCEKTGILKSQMNQILNKMIEKDLIIKERSSTDKREVLIYLKDVKSFDLQHDKIMMIVQKITSKLGDKRSKEVAELFNLVADIAAKEKL